MGTTPQIYLHIGHGKVASSTIQSFLQHNADEIRRQGLLIADVNFEFPRSGPVSGYPIRIFQEWIADPDPGGRRLSEALRREMERCREEGFRGVVISSEFLGTSEAATWFGNVETGAPVETLFYLRRQDQLLESAWKQWSLKNGVSLNAFVDRSLRTGFPRFLEISRRWRDAVDRLTVVPIESVENIQGHFADWCGLDFSRLDPVDPANRTYDWALLDLLSRSPFCFEDQNDNRLFDFLDEILPEEIPRDGHGLMTGDQTKQILDAFEAENRDLRREFFPDLPASAWEEPPTEKENSGRIGAFGSMESVFRNLAIQLMLSQQLYERLQSDKGRRKIAALDERAGRIAASITRRMSRLRSRLEREEARRRELEKRVNQLENRSLRKRIARLFTRNRRADRRRID